MRDFRLQHSRFVSFYRVYPRLLIHVSVRRFLVCRWCCGLFFLRAMLRRSIDTRSYVAVV